MSRWLLVVAVAVAAVVVGVLVVADPLRPTPNAASPSPGPPSSAAATVKPSRSPTSSPTLHLDGLATVTAPSGLRLREQPAGKKVKGAAATIADGTTVFLDSERVTGEGESWWAVEPTKSFSYGWVPAAEARGATTLAAFEPGCPPVDTLDAATIQRIGTMTALVCYGDDDLALRGLITCTTAAIDSAVAGASWLPFNAICDLDQALSLNGHVEETLLVAGASPQDPASGRYQVIGHFDDPESRLCFTVPFGVSVTSPANAPEPIAIVACRASFVVTWLTPIP